MYDNTCKFLAENFPSDFAAWILGKPIPLTKLEPSELSNEPIRADSVIFLQSSEIILHLEFQTQPDQNMPFRMLDYQVRLYRKFSNRQFHQVVIYLKPTKSPLVYETEFNLPNTSHKFNVIRLWEEPTAIFQRYSGLLPFAPLSNTNDPEETLKQVAKQIANISDKNLQSNLAASTYITAGLVLNKEIIHRLLRSEVMKESVTYQEILLEGLAEGKARGLAEGLAEGKTRGLAEGLAEGLAKGKTRGLAEGLAEGLAKGKARGLARGKARGLAEGKVKGLAEGKTETVRQIALNMWRSHFDVNLIAQLTGLSVEEIQKL